MFNDSKARLAINYGRVYLMGFSGGARIANALTLMDNVVSGVICCGAASPAANPKNERNEYSFFGIAGTSDFNYSEMFKYDLLDLAGHNVKHTLITFDGKHEWPPQQTMEEAFQWLEINNMHKDPSARNNDVIAANIAKEAETLQTLNKAKKEYEAFVLCQKVINYYEGLADLSFFYSTYKQLQTSTIVDKKLKQKEADWTREEKLKQEYIHNLQANDIDWWQKDIAKLNQQIKNGSDKNEILIKKRVLGYLSLVCYMQTSAALKQNDIAAAEHFGKLYVLVDPTNTEAHYFMAEIHAKQGNTSASVKSLDEAVKNGFTDKKRIENDSAFTGFKNDAGFVKVIEKMK
jgi:hypothetical protein